MIKLVALCLLCAVACFAQCPESVQDSLHLVDTTYCDVAHFTVVFPGTTTVIVRWKHEFIYHSDEPGPWPTVYHYIPAIEPGTYEIKADDETVLTTIVADPMEYIEWSSQFPAVRWTIERVPHD